MPLLEHGVDSRKLRVLHNGIDINRFTNVIQRSDVRKSLDLPEESCVITTAGRIMKSKGHGVIVDAMAEVVRHLPKALFLFAGAPFHGEAGFGKDLRRRIDESSLSVHAKFLGFRDDMESIFAASDIVVQASQEPDAFPTVVLEAMAAGCIVIASDIGGAREIISDGVNGFLVPPGEPRELAKKIINVVKTGSTSAIAQVAQQTIMSRFAEERYVEEMTTWIEGMGST
jgi:glycosyltransferase involved in cell wall biosynthesis